MVHRFRIKKEHTSDEYLDNSLTYLFILVVIAVLAYNI